MRAKPLLQGSLNGSAGAGAWANSIGCTAQPSNIELKSDGAQLKLYHKRH